MINNVSNIIKYQESKVGFFPFQNLVVGLQIILWTDNFTLSQHKNIEGILLRDLNRWTSWDTILSVTTKIFSLELINAETIKAEGLGTKGDILRYEVQRLKLKLILLPYTK